MRVIRDLFHQLHAVLHGTETLVYSNHPSEAAASKYLATTFAQIAGGVPWFLRSTVVPMQLPHQCRHCQCSVIVTAGTGVSRGSLKQPRIVFDIRSLTWDQGKYPWWDEWSFPQLLLLWGLSYPGIAEPCYEQINPVSGFLGMPEG